MDRGALDAALAAEVPCGGYCPAGRRAEDGIIPDRYPLEETTAADYATRTRLNVEAAEATLVLCAGALRGGTALTVECCATVGRPVLVIDAGQLSAEQAGDAVADFVRDAGASVVNVAGPRASEWPGGYRYAREAIARLIRCQSATP